VTAILIICAANFAVIESISYKGFNSTISIATTFFVFKIYLNKILKNSTENPKGPGALTPGA
jgi:hypothetical protein